MAILAHVLGLFTSFIGPMIMYLVKRDGSFSARHALHATWWQVGYAVCTSGAAFIFFLVFVSSMPSGRGQMSPGALVPVLLLYCVFFVLWIANLLISIMNAVRASRGQEPSYLGVSGLLR